MIFEDNLSRNIDDYINSATKTACRLCLKKYDSNEFEDIFKSFGNNTTIAGYITNFAEIPITKEDCFAKIVCGQCLNHLHEIENFRQSISDNHKRLNHLYTLYRHNLIENNSNVSEALAPNVKKENEFETVVIKSELDHDSFNDKSDLDVDDTKIDILEHNPSDSIDKSDEIPIEKPKRTFKRNPNLRYPCNYCDRVFKSYKGRMEHLLVHTGQYYECEICKKKYLSKFIFMRHKKNHVDGKLECTECGKQYECLNSLKVHMETHTPTGNYQCEQCGKRFAHPRTFKSHCLSHSLKVKELKCDICDKVIRSRYAKALTKHKETHLENFEKNCTICGKLFKSKGGFHMHLKKHNSSEFKCDLCPKQYTSQKNLEEHITSAHSEMKPFSCEICGKTFALKAYWHKHGTVHAKKNPISCKVCEKKFGYPSDLREHSKSVHGIV